MPPAGDLTRFQNVTGSMAQSADSDSSPSADQRSMLYYQFETTPNESRDR